MEREWGFLITPTRHAGGEGVRRVSVNLGPGGKTMERAQETSRRDTASAEETPGRGQGGTIPGVRNLKLCVCEK